MSPLKNRNKKLMNNNRQRSPISPLFNSPVRTAIKSNNSTPLSSRYNNTSNNMFCDESPSRENEIFSPTCSQDIQRFGTDVTWQWNSWTSPKRHLEHRSIRKLEDKKLFLKNRHILSKQKEKREKEKTSTEVTGFFKFQEELLSFEKNQILNEINKDENISPKDSIQLEIMKTPENKKKDLHNSEKIKILSNRRNSERKGYLGCSRIKDIESPRLLLDDSDSDLLKCSEYIEESMLKNSQLKNLCNDSIDEILSDIPLDEVISQYYTVKSEQHPFEIQINNKSDNTVNSSSGYCSAVTSNRKNFLRYNSMPDSPKIIIKEKEVSVKERSFSRHVSMPIDEQKKFDGLTNTSSSLSQASTSGSSIDSLISNSSSYRCSADQIAEKRRQAIERLRMNKIFNKNVDNLSTHNSQLNSNSNKNNNRITNISRKPF